jgi:hypothetical protein
VDEFFYILKPPMNCHNEAMRTAVSIARIGLAIPSADVID